MKNIVGKTFAVIKEGLIFNIVDKNNPSGQPRQMWPSKDAQFAVTGYDKAKRAYYCDLIIDSHDAPRNLCTEIHENLFEKQYFVEAAAASETTDTEGMFYTPYTGRWSFL